MSTSKQGQTVSEFQQLQQCIHRAALPSLFQNFQQHSAQNKMFQMTAQNNLKAQY